MWGSGWNVWSLKGRIWGLVTRLGPRGMEIGDHQPAEADADPRAWRCKPVIPLGDERPSLPGEPMTFLWMNEKNVYIRYKLILITKNTHKPTKQTNKCNKNFISTTPVLEFEGQTTPTWAARGEQAIGGTGRSQSRLSCKEIWGKRRVSDVTMGSRTWKWWARTEGKDRAASVTDSRWRSRWGKATATTDDCPESGFFAPLGFHWQNHQVHVYSGKCHRRRQWWGMDCFNWNSSSHFPFYISLTHTPKFTLDSLVRHCRQEFRTCYFVFPVQIH